MTDATAEAGRFIDALAKTGRILAVKVYRMDLPQPPGIPAIPCLDHEAMLHGGIPPHMAAYFQRADDGGLHELVLVPARRRVSVDTVSTWGEHRPETIRDVVTYVARSLPDYRISVERPSWWRADQRVAEACRAHVTLRQVLLGQDLGTVKEAVDRMQTVGALMEKNSRVASWGVRTLTGPLLAAAGVVTFQILGRLSTEIGEANVTTLRSGLIGVLGAVFLYYGMKAVQLTNMANRVWKRAAEYALILAERRRLTSGAGTAPSDQ